MRSKQAMMFGLLWYFAFGCSESSNNEVAVNNQAPTKNQDSANIETRDLATGLDDYKNLFSSDKKYRIYAQKSSKYYFIYNSNKTGIKTYTAKPSGNSQEELEWKITKISDISYTIKSKNGNGINFFNNDTSSIINFTITLTGSLSQKKYTIRDRTFPAQTLYLQLQPQPSLGFKFLSGCYCLSLGVDCFCAAEDQSPSSDTAESTTWHIEEVVDEPDTQTANG